MNKKAALSSGFFSMFKGLIEVQGSAPCVCVANGIWCGNTGRGDLSLFQTSPNQERFNGWIASGKVAI